MSDETKHVTPSAPRTLSDKPYPIPDGKGRFVVPPLLRSKDVATMSPASDAEIARLAEVNVLQRIVGDRNHTLALVPDGLSKQGWLRLAEFCTQQARKA